MLFRSLNGIAKDEDGIVINIANPVEIKFQMTNLNDSAQTVSKTSAVVTEIAKINPAAGIYKVYIQAADTKNLDPGKYRYEVIFIDVPGAPVEVYTLNPTEYEKGYCLLHDVLIEV